MIRYDALNTFWGRLILLSLLGGLCFFWGLDAYGLMHNNEGLYAQIPKEMLERSNYIIPYLNGVPYIEKPPLLYWLIMGAYKLFGVSVWSARFVPAIFGLGTCLSIYVFSEKVGFVKAGFIGALILMSLGAFNVFSRMVYFDGLLTFFLTISLFSFYVAQEKRSSPLLALSYVLLALAILTKGFVALILYGLIVVTWIMVTKQFSLVLWLLKPAPLAGFFLIIAPWHILAHFQDPTFSHFYFVNEHFLRFLGKRQPQDYYHGPVYYYIPRLTLYFLPWTLVALQSFRKIPPSSFKTFLWIWAGVCFTFFSLSQAKANYYVITLLPPLALLIALGWQERPSYVRTSPVIFSIILLIGSFYGAFKGYGFEPCYVFLFLSLFTVWAYRKKEMFAWTPYLFLMHSFALLCCALFIVPTFENDISAKNFLNIPKNTCLYRDFEKMSSVVFYSGKPLPLYHSLSNDLMYGVQRTPAMTVLKTEVLKRCPNFFVFHEQNNLFKQEFPTYHAIQHRGKITLYTQTP